MGFDSSDETKIVAMGFKCKSSLHVGSSSKNVYQVNDKERIGLFHIIFLSKHTNIDTLFDPGSHGNLIS